MPVNSVCSERGKLANSRMINSPPEGRRSILIFSEDEDVLKSWDEVESVTIGHHWQMPRAVRSL